MENIMDIILLLIPVLLLHIALAVISITHIVRYPNYKRGNKVIWILVCLFIQIIGPVLYFSIGKGERE